MKHQNIYIQALEKNFVENLLISAKEKKIIIMIKTKGYNS